jgi:glyoxylase-like metal-dependent hydrolase (beta-lactamase superfamily II)/rhodanese-related sulfurtransferase
MFIKQIYTNCLAEAAYYIESEGEAAVIDPIRDTTEYHSLAESRKAKINYVFETHVHADFVSGHLDLSAESGAPIVFGPGAKTGFTILQATHLQEFKLGNCSLQVLHTPGHTLESICILAKNQTGTPLALFTGDTLFIGDVGRPDLAGDNEGLTKEILAGKLYDSIHSQILPLPDEVIIYPAHGAGSACGKNIGKETFSTLGVQRKTNYALLAPNREAFIKLVTDGLSAPPTYFFKDAGINKNGYTPLPNLLTNAQKSLHAKQVEEKLKHGSLLLDSREPDAFEKGFYKGAINIGLSGQFAIWAATLIPLDKSIILVCEPGKEQESATRLARVGFEHIEGFTEGGFSENFGLPCDYIQSIEPQEFLNQLQGNKSVLDVRNPGEQANGVVSDAQLLPLAELMSSLHTLPKNQTLMVHCAGGYRSMIACSLLKQAGFEQVENVRKGMNGIKQTGLSLQLPISH